MIGYETEEQQVQAIKQFWKDNGMAIMLGAVIGIGGLWGWRWYTDSTISSKEVASSSFQASIESMVENEDVTELEGFLNQNGDTGYAPLAAMILAQQAVEKEDYDGAKAAIQKAITADTEIADVARLRLANLHLQLEEYDQALAVLENVKSLSFQDQVEELKGDALTETGDFEGAKTAYTLALAKSPNNQILKMKRDNIAYAKSQAVSDASE